MLRASLKWLLRIVFFAVALVVLVGAVAYWHVGYREDESRETLAPSSGRLIQAGDASLFVQEAGPAKGPAILLIAGTGAWSELWRVTIDALASAGYRVIAPDLPPFGFSERLLGPESYSREAQAVRIIELLKVLQVPTVTIVGHSVGARAALEVALRAPERVSRLVLVDPALGLKVGDGGLISIEQNAPSFFVRTLFGLPAVRDSLLGAYATNSFFTQQLFNSFVSNKEAVTEERTHTLQMPLPIERTTSAYGDWLHALVVSHDAALGANLENLKKLAMPVFIIWGRDDTVTPLAQGEALQRLIPQSDLAVIDNVGHIPYIEDPRIFNIVLRSFLSPPSALRAR